MSKFCTPSHPTSLAFSECAVRRRLSTPTQTGNHLAGARSDVTRPCSRASSPPTLGTRPSDESFPNIVSEACADGKRQGWPARHCRFTSRQHRAFTGGASRRHVARRSIPPGHNSEADVASEASDSSYKTYNNGSLHSGKPRAENELSASERLVRAVSIVLPGIRDFCANNFLLLGACGQLGR